MKIYLDKCNKSSIFALIFRKQKINPYVLDA